MLTIITEISSLTLRHLWGRHLQYFSTSKTTKSHNKAGKALPKGTVSPWFPMGRVFTCSRGTAGAPAAGQGVLALSQSQPSTPGKKPQAQNQPDMAGTLPQLEADKRAEPHWSREAQQLPGVKISAAGQAGNLHGATWESTLHCPLPVLCPATWHPSVQSWSCMTDTKGNILILMFKITMLKLTGSYNGFWGILFTFLKKHQYCKELTG